MLEQAKPDLLQLTALIVSAHISNNSVGADALPELIQSVYTSLATTGVKEAAPSAPLEPAVPIKKSVFPDYLVCLEDGEKMKLLKRHLKTSYNLTPQQYREKWGLPFDYPMVAPSYAAKRSSLAKSIGLGVKRNVVEPEQDAEPQVTHVPARKARGSKG